MEALIEMDLTGDSTREHGKAGVLHGQVTSHGTSRPVACWNLVRTLEQALAEALGLVLGSLSLASSQSMASQ